MCACYWGRILSSSSTVKALYIKIIILWVQRLSEIYSDPAREICGAAGPVPIEIVWFPQETTVQFEIPFLHESFSHLRTSTLSHPPIQTHLFAPFLALPVFVLQEYVKPATTDCRYSVVQANSAGFT